MFTAKCKLYYKAGNPKPKHKPPIASGDMAKLSEYFSKYDTDPVILTHYIWFSFCLYFGRRGREGWREFKSDSFAVKTDDQNRQYITMLKTEQTKNHQGGHKQSEQDYSDQRVYETSGKLDPVTAYNLYMSKRHPECDAFFQTPRVKFNIQDHWYRNEPIGKNTIATIMQKISKRANLSQVYTCHSVRATTVTILGRAGYQNSNICKITKHTNEHSLNHYFDDLSTDQKAETTNILSHALVRRQPTATITSAEQATGIVPSSEQPTASSSALVPVSNSTNPEIPIPVPSTSEVIAEKYPDGSYAITLPSISDNNTQQITSVSSDKKFLQNVLPNCSFDNCTININTSDNK